MNYRNNNCLIVPCPTQEKYPEAPKDQSKCELFDCPKCKSKMWLSSKKKGIILLSCCLGKEIILACYDCITKMAEESPSLFSDIDELQI